METIYRKSIYFFETICNSYRYTILTERCIYITVLQRMSEGLSKEYESSDSARVGPVDLTMHTVVSGPRRNNIPTPAQHLWSPPYRFATDWMNKTGRENSIKWHLLRYPLNSGQTIIFLFCCNETLNISCMFLCFAMVNRQWNIIFHCKAFLWSRMTISGFTKN